MLEQLPEHIRSVLSVFSRRKVPDDSRRHGKDAEWSLDNDALWTLRARSCEDWVCRLSVALLLRVSSAKLSACRIVAARKHKLAELLLPHALADLAACDADKSLRRIISAQVRSLQKGCYSSLERVSLQGCTAWKGTQDRSLVQQAPRLAGSRQQLSDADVVSNDGIGFHSPTW